MAENKDLVKVVDMGFSMDSSHQLVVFLKGEVDGEKKYITLWIGLLEFHAIVRKLENINPNHGRPMTIDKLVGFAQWIEELRGVKFFRVIITKLENNTYFAELEDEEGWRMKDLGERMDFRPSDAIALALHMEIPVYVHRDVFKAYKEHADQKGDYKVKNGPDLGKFEFSEKLQ